MTSMYKLPVANSVCKAHYKDGVIRAYVDGVLALRCPLDAPITATKHGVRLATVNTSRWDNLLGVATVAVPSEDKSGGLQSAAFTYGSGQERAPASFVYRGRDTKIQDTTAGA
jgi:hypothetical protein